METISARPSARICSATSGILIRLVVTKGIFTSPFIFCVTHVKAALGTMVAIVGIRASCQPIPVLMILTPAFSNSFANNTTSSHVLPSGTKSNIESLNMRINSSPTLFLISLTISSGNFILFLYSPPHSSVRLLVFFAINWLIK